MTQPARKLIGLDEKINLAGRITTIREQFQLGNARPSRLGGKSFDDPESRHFVNIQKDFSGSEQFDISEADFKWLGG